MGHYYGLRTKAESAAWDGRFPVERIKQNQAKSPIMISWQNIKLKKQKTKQTNTQKKKTEIFFKNNEY